MLREAEARKRLDDGHRPEPTLTQSRSRRREKPDEGVRDALIASIEVDDADETQTSNERRAADAERARGQADPRSEGLAPHEGDGRRAPQAHGARHRRRSRVGRGARRRSRCSRARRSTTASREGRTGITLALTAAIVAVGAVQAVGTGLRRYAAFGLAWRVETDIRMRLVAHLQRLHFAFHDQAQTGQLMAYANTDIQQINNVVLLDPAHDREHDPDGRGRRSSSCCAAPGLALFALGLLPLLNISATRFSHRMYPGRACSCRRSSPTSRASSRRASPASAS